MSEKYIYSHINTAGEKVYVIRKTFHNKTFNHGTYYNLKEAIKKRDELIKNNWNRPSYKYYYKSSDSGHYTIQKNNVKIGTLHTLKQARRIIEYLITYNWDTSKLPGTYKKILKENRNYRGIKDGKYYYKNKNGYDIIKNNKYYLHVKNKEVAEYYVDYLKKNNWKTPVPKYYYYNNHIRRYIVSKKTNGEIKYYGSHRQLSDAKKHVEELIMKGEIQL